MNLHTVTNQLTPEHLKNGVFKIPLPLTAKERKFGRKQGWRNIGVNNQIPHTCAIRPDGITCGIYHATREIRRARTLAFLEGAK